MFRPDVCAPWADKAELAVRPLVFLGNATYSSYMIHFPIQITTVLIVDALGLSRSLFLSPITFLTYLTTVAVTSLLVYHFFEVPAQSWIRANAALAIRGKRQKATAA